MSGRPWPRPCPTGSSAIHGERRLTWADIERRANGVAAVPARPRRRPPGQGGPLPLQLPRVHGVDLRHLQGRARARQHQLPLQRRRARLPVGQRRRRGGHLPRRLRRAHRPGSVTGCRACGAGCGWTTAPARARRGRRPTTRCRRDRRGRGRTARGAAAGDDLLLLYTGGTTGMPKGVMWRQDDLFAMLNAGDLLRVPRGRGPRRRPRDIAAPGPAHMPGLPADARHRGVHRHGGHDGGRLRRDADRSPLRPRRAPRHRRRPSGVNSLAIVGDAFAKPILAALDEHPGRWELSTLLAFVSSGVMWSEETKRGLLRHHPNLMLVDAFWSSEAVGMGTSVSSGTAAEHTARFTLGPDVRVLDRVEQGRHPGIGRGRDGRPRGPQSRRLLQGPRQVGQHLQGDRRRAVLGPRGLRHRRRRRGHPPPRARLGGHQHRRGEGVPRGGGGSP